jgi:hypothetical protein
MNGCSLQGKFKNRLFLPQNIFSEGNKAAKKRRLPAWRQEDGLPDVIFTL